MGTLIIIVIFYFIGKRISNQIKNQDPNALRSSSLYMKLPAILTISIIVWNVIFFVWISSFDIDAIKANEVNSYQQEQQVQEKK